MAKRKQDHTEENINVSELIALQEELDELRAEHGIEVKKNWLERILEKYYAFKDKHTFESPVKKKTYCWLCLLGPFGVHHFYARHWVKGLLYLGTCWCGISCGMTLIDWMVAFPKKPDENGMILI